MHLKKAVKFDFIRGTKINRIPQWSQVSFTKKKICHGKYSWGLFYRSQICVLAYLEDFWSGQIREKKISKFSKKSHPYGLKLDEIGVKFEILRKKQVLFSLNLPGFLGLKVPNTIIFYIWLLEIAIESILYVFLTF